MGVYWLVLWLIFAHSSDCNSSFGKESKSAVITAAHHHMQPSGRFYGTQDNKGIVASFLFLHSCPRSGQCCHLCLEEENNFSKKNERKKVSIIFQIRGPIVFRFYFI